MRSVKKFRILTWLAVLAAATIGGLWLLVPRSYSAPASYTPFATSLALFDMGIAIGGAALFLWALRSFRSELKPAYRFIAFAQLALSLIALFNPIILFYNLWTNPLFNTLAYIGYFTASIFMFFGLRKFAFILDLKTRLTSVWLVFGLAFAAGVAHIFIPHAPAPAGMSEAAYDTFEFIPTIPLLTYGAALYITLRLRQKVGHSYKRAFMWLAIGLGTQLFTALLTAGMEIVGYDNVIYNSGLYMIPLLGGDVGLLIAAYQFNIIGLPVPSRRQNQQASSVDIVTYAAGMVSAPVKIDPQLDKLRSITARQEEGQPAHLTQNDQLTLRDIYLAIEKYLMHDDALRHVTQQELRGAIANTFSEADLAHTFWPTLSAAPAPAKLESPVA